MQELSFCSRVLISYLINTEVMYLRLEFEVRSGNA
jgi:hypothetical protein